MGKRGFKILFFALIGAAVVGLAVYLYRRKTTSSDTRSTSAGGQVLENAPATGRTGGAPSEQANGTATGRTGNSK